VYLFGTILSHVVAHDRAVAIDTKDVQVDEIVHFVFTVMFFPLSCENCSVGETTWDGSLSHTTSCLLSSNTTGKHPNA
jgi:hypothetical protein